MSFYYWKFPIITNEGYNRILLIKEEGDSPMNARNKITRDIILLSRRGIPRFYFNRKYICLSHSNDDRMLNFDYFEVDSSLFQKLSISLPEIITPEFVKQSGLNKNAEPFIPIRYSRYS
jgi:hypothetical protein